MMATVRMRPAAWVSVPVVLVALCGIASAEDKDPLREKALKLNDITGDDVMTGKIKEFLADTPGTKKMLAVAAKMAKEKDQPFEYNAAFVLARTAQLVKDYDNSEVFYKVCAEQAFKLQSANKLIQVYDGLIDLFYENKKYDDAIKACKEFIDLRGNEDVEKIKPFVMERMVQSLAKQGKTKDALKLTESLINADDGGWYFVQLKGWVQREAGEFAAAAETYEDSLDRIQKSKTMKDDNKERFTERVKYVLSGVYVEDGKIDKAAEQLQWLLKKKPENPTYNNDLGYIWADHDMKIDESEKLIRKAIEEDRKQRKMIEGILPEEDKDNAAYLDSLGWVLFKQKKFAEAKKVMLEATQLEDGQHIEILDHLADVHMALGEKSEAVAVWKKALTQEPLTRREKQRKAEIEKKIKSNE
jgi:tetratricopeptide (TPR) repeat protein